MEFIADLHIHSRFSRATSRALNLQNLWTWAQLKGVSVLGTGDFTHPGWFAEIEENLTPCEDGLYQLKPEIEKELQSEVPRACQSPVRFMLTVEISNIYKAQERTRKVHNLIAVPDLETASRFNRALSKIGNLNADGRPILGLDSRDLLEITLTASDRAALIPAHIWTPWFSVLGSKSGFDSIEECYRDLSPHIFALETGLSSDPAMNWRVSSLDKFCLVSNSDAHSPAKIAREANVFGCEMSYDAMFAALRHPKREGFVSTIEFFPEEGKYHLDGHRKCGVRFSPEKTLEHSGICPVCGKPLTLGVLYRVLALADSALGHKPPAASPYISLVGLDEILAETLGRGAATKGVQKQLHDLYCRLGPELHILRSVPLDEIRVAGGPVLTEAIKRMRTKEVYLSEGYDGEFGKISIFGSGERERIAGQTGFFGEAVLEDGEKEPSLNVKASSRRREEKLLFERSLLMADPREEKRFDDIFPSEGNTEDNANGFLQKAEQTSSLERASISVPKRVEQTSFFESASISASTVETEDELLAPLSEEQRHAVTHLSSPIVITAGPGTGKTRVLTHRIAYGVKHGLVPENVLAVTFTNKAAAEMQQRLMGLMAERQALSVRVMTFHALALYLSNQWRQEDGKSFLRVIDEEEKNSILKSIYPEANQREISRRVKQISLAFLQGIDSLERHHYQAYLEEHALTDLDALVPNTVKLLKSESSYLCSWRDRFQMVCVDEYQDVNQAQYELVRLLCPDGNNLCVIGDPDQAIYSFRGADPRYFLCFEKDYPQALQLSLQRSYRTASSILEAAQQVISHNPHRKPQRTLSDVKGASKVCVCRVASASAEAEFIVHAIEELVGGTTLYSLDSGRSDGHSALIDGQELTLADFAVLYRMRTQADSLIEAFDRSGIPYVRSRIDTPPPLEPLYEFLRLLCLGSKSLVIDNVHTNSVSSLKTDRSPFAAELNDAPMNQEGGSNRSICRGGSLHEFVNRGGSLHELFDEVAHLEAREGLFTLAQALCPVQHLEAALDQVKQLAAQIYDAKSDVWRWGPLALSIGASRSEVDNLPQNIEAVSLLTLHASKGLEFPAVFIVGCEEGLLPYQINRAEDDGTRTAEERRLFYVGMTRAKRLLVISSARKRQKQSALKKILVSRFVSEMPDELMFVMEPGTLRRRNKTTQLTLF